MDKNRARSIVWPHSYLPKWEQDPGETSQVLPMHKYMHFCVLAFTTVNQKPGSAQKQMQSAFHRNIIFLLCLAKVTYLVMLFLSHPKNLHQLFSA